MEPLLSRLSTFFPWLIDYTVDISILICLIFIIKSITSKKLPAWWQYSLWIILLIRMIIPVTFENSLEIPNVVPITIDERLFESILIEPEFITAELTTELSSSTQQGWHLQVDDVMVLIWLICAIIFGIYVLVKNITFRATINKEPLVTDKKILDLLEKCKSRMKADTPLKITITDKIKSPALFGYIRPRLLLPAGVLEILDDDELSYIFMHELGHLKRHDIGVSWVITFLHIFQWFNPFVWLAFYQMRIDQESACDASVLSRIKHDQTIDYASTIVGFLENFCRNRKLSAMVGILENQTQIKKRITMIVSYRKYSKTMSSFSAAILVIIGFLFFSLAGFAKVKDDVTGFEPSIIQTVPFEVSKEMVEEENVVMHEEALISFEESQKVFDLSQERADESKEVQEKQDLKIREDLVDIHDNKEYEKKELRPPAVLQKTSNAAQERVDQAKVVQVKQDLKIREDLVDTQDNKKEEKEALRTPAVVQKASNTAQERADEAKVVQVKQDLQTQEALVKVPDNNIIDKIEAVTYTESPRKAPAEVLKVFREVYNISAGNKDILNHSFAANGNDQTVIISPNRSKTIKEKSMNYLGLARPVYYRSDNPDHPEGSAGIPENKPKGEKIYNLKEVDVRPEIVRYHPPRYPYRAQGKGIEGKVLLRFIVDKAGNVKNPKVVSAEPEGTFEKSALDTVAKYKLKPAMKDGKSVNSYVNFRIFFTLKDNYLRLAQR